MLDCNQSKPVQALFEGLRPALVGMIFASAFSVGKTAIFDITTLFIVIFVLYLINKAKIDPIKILLISGVIGFVIYK
jgi:chromate transporter